MVKIAPSILAANSTCLGQEVQSLEKAHADLIHFDVMDGHFVPNLTFGPKILKELKHYSSLPFDVHLMVTDPLQFIPWYADAGADILTFHLEAVSNPKEVIQFIHKFGIKAGISVKPETDITLLLPYLHSLDLLLIMSVNPGFGGQKFQINAIKRIQEAKKLIGSQKTIIEVDGGINCENAKSCIDAGADILVAGTSIFKNGTYKENIQTLRGE